MLVQRGVVPGSSRQEDDSGAACCPAGFSGRRLLLLALASTALSSAVGWPDPSWNLPTSRPIHRYSYRQTRAHNLHSLVSTEEQACPSVITTRLGPCNKTSMLEKQLVSG